MYRFPVKSSKGVAAIHHARAPRNSTHSARGTADASCDTAITPTCLQQLYNIPTDAATQSANTLAVSSFVDSFASTSDLSSFLTEFRPDVSSGTTFDVVSVDNGENDETNPSTEGVCLLANTFQASILTCAM